MTEERFTFAGADGILLPAVLWLPDEPPKAILQITHGMTEHKGRYEVLAKSLTDKGIAAAAFDLRGHGENPSESSCASLGEGGWSATLEDMHLFFLHLQQRLPDLPHFMMGFSLGSFLLREYLGIHRTSIAGAAILGTGWQPGGLLMLMRLIAKTQILQAGFNKSTPLVKKLSFDTYNSHFLSDNSSLAWLCADKRQREQYERDPLCRDRISAGLFWQLLGSMKRTGSSESLDGWYRYMPILLMSGHEDPVGSMGKSVIKLEGQMKQSGLKRVTIRLFMGARHDILHEEVSGAGVQSRNMLGDWILHNLHTRTQESTRNYLE